MSKIPKLNKNQQKTAAAAESGSFKPLEPGRYVGTLKEVSVKEGPSGPGWSWEFENLIDEAGNKAPGRQWVYTSLSEKSAWKLKEVFEAFGYTLDSDTDEIIGDKAVLHISIEIAERGKRKGEEVNRVDRVSAYDESEWDSPTEGDAGDDVW